MSRGKGILDRENPEKRDEIVALLTKAYWMEVETAMSQSPTSIPSPMTW